MSDELLLRYRPVGRGGWAEEARVSSNFGRNGAKAVLEPKYPTFRGRATQTPTYLGGPGSIASMFVLKKIWHASNTKVLLHCTSEGLD